MKKNRSQRRDQLSYSKLENRHLLAADFSFDGGVLTLDEFVNSSALAADNLTIQNGGGGEIDFLLSDGVWNGTPVPGVTVAGSVLTVGSFLPDEIVINSTTGDQFDIEFGELNFSGDIRIENDLAPFGSVTQQFGTNIDFGSIADLFTITGAQTIVLEDSMNDFGFIEIDNAISASVVDANNLGIAGAEVTIQLQLVAGANDPIVGSGASNGELIIQGDLTAGQILLQASEGATQSSGGIIAADQLFLGGDEAIESAGVFLLNQANQVNELAAALTFDNNGVDSSLVFSNDQDLTIIEGTYTSLFGASSPESFTGLSIGDDLSIDVTNGTLQQTDGSIIVDGATDLMASGDVLLPGVDADGDGVEDNSFGVSPSILAGGDIVFSIDADLTPSLTAGGRVTLATIGDLTITPALVANGGSLGFIADRITIDTDIVVDSLFLQASNGVELVDTFIVDVNDLSLAGVGNFDFVTGPGINNVIDTLSADIAGSLDLESSSNLALSTLSVEVGDSGAALEGNLNLSAETITSADISSDIVAGNVSLSSNGIVSLNNLASTSGDVDISAGGPAIVSTIDAFDNVTVETVGDITIDTIESSFGTVFLSSFEGVDVGEVVAMDNVSIGSALQGVDLGRVVSSSGSVLVSAGANNLIAQEVEAAVDVTLDAAGGNLITSAVSAGNIAELTASGNQTALQLDAGTGILTAGIDLRVNDIQADDLTLSAGDDVRDIQFGDGLGVTTDSLVVTAGNSINEVTSGGITLETNVDFLSATVEGDAFGNVIIREADGLALGVIDVGDGRVAITAGGTISGGDIQTRVQVEQNDVRLIATGDDSDILVDQIDVGDGDVVLIADDDVGNIGGGNVITAETIFARANNRSAGGTDGIALATDVGSVQLIVGDPDDASQNRGDISITDQDSLLLDFARTLVGTISATANNGNLVAANIQSEGVNQADAISLTALGTGADVVTGRVVVRNQAGGIVLNAADDVRDSNLQDGFETIADNLSIVAQNNLSDNFNGINSQSRVRSVDATVENGDGALLINNIGLLAVNQANLSSGFVRVNNLVGSVQINNITLTGSSSENRVIVNTFTSNADILVGSIDAGDGNVLLDSADDIFDTSLLDDLFIEGVFLSATSQNGSIGPFDGIFLEADVDSFAADALGGGEEFVRQPA